MATDEITLKVSDVLVDAFSPEAEVTQTDTGATITITDLKHGTSTATIKNGENGDSPVKGTDYWTDSDKSEIVNDVLEALPKWEGGSY